MTDWLRRGRLIAVCSLLGGMLLSAHVGIAAAGAATIDDSLAALGSSVLSVQASHPDAERPRAPRRSPSGAAGLLRIPVAFCEGYAFEQTFFFRDQQLTEVDMVWQGPEGGGATTSAAAFTALVGGLRQRYGAELASAASTATTVMETASWVAGGRSITLFRSGRADHPVLRMVVRQRQVVDAGEL